MTDEKLRQMLQNGFTHESSFVERKPGNFKDREARKTIVAFANSTLQLAAIWKAKSAKNIEHVLNLY